MANEPENPAPKIRTHSYHHLDIAPNENEPGGTMRSPGNFDLYTATHKSLVTVSQMRGASVNRVEHVQVANIEGDMRVWIYPTDAHDPDRITLRQYKSRLSLNLSKILTKWKLALPTGQKRVYDLHIDPTSPVGPALVLHLDKPLEVKWIKSAKKGETPASQAAPATQPPTSNSSEK